MALTRLQPFNLSNTASYEFGNLNLSGNIVSLNANLGNSATANFFIGSGNNLSNIQGANVSGAVATANVASTVSGNTQSNITSLGTLTGLTVSGITNLGTVANVIITGGSNGQILTTNGSGNLSWITIPAGSNISNGNSNVSIPVANGNIILSAEGNANIVVVTGTGAVLNGNLTTGNGTGGNISGANVITANTANISAALNVTGTSNLGPVGNVTITGGSSGQYLQTNGSGVLSWSTISTGSISNGNSNVNIPAANGNINLSAAGNSNVLVVTGTGINVAGTLNATGNANVGNLGATGVVATTLGGSLTTASQPNITSVGTLSSLTVTGNISAGNANLGNAVTANFFIGNGSLLTGMPSGNSIANGNSNVNIPAANGNVNISVAGNSNVLIVTGTGVNVTGTLNSTGNITGANASLGNIVTANFVQGTLTTAAQPNITSLGTLGSLTTTGNVSVGGNLSVTAKSNLGPAGNVIITGGIANYVLSTDGAGNLSWVAQTGGGGNGTPGGSNTQVQFNDAGAFAGNAGLTFDKTTTTFTANNFVATSTANLGAVGNVIITGGTNGQVLSTNGSGSLSWNNVGTTITVDDFTGNGSQTAYTLTTIPASVDYTLVSIAGTFQPRNAYSLVGNVLTFTSAPPNTALIEVTTFTAAVTAGANTGNFLNRSYTANGVQDTFTVTNGVTANSVIVTENGIVQEPGTDYTVSGSNLTFTTAPANTTAISIREIPAPGGGGSVYASASANLNASANTKYVLNTNSANIVVTLPGGPSFGMEVGVIDGTGNANTNAITVYGNGANIQGSNSNMTVNTSRAAFTLVYYDATNGWLLTNV
jgi:hypothetical protein